VDGSKGRSLGIIATNFGSERFTDMIDGVEAFASFLGKLIDLISALPPFPTTRRKPERKIAKVATKPKGVEEKKA
jgi:hypothetical protein